MSEEKLSKTVDELTIGQWLRIRKEEGRKIDPESAMIWSHRGDTVDPYGVYPRTPDNYECSGEVYFACSRESGIWVSFNDLIYETRRRLWERLDSQESGDIPF